MFLTIGLYPEPEQSPAQCDTGFQGDNLQFMGQGPRLQGLFSEHSKFSTNSELFLEILDLDCIPLPQV